MSRPTVIPENIQQKIKDLEAEIAHWTKVRDTSSGVRRRLAQTSLTHFEARLRWYRGRAQGKKPDSAFSTPGRKATKTLNQQKLAEARS